MKVRGIIIRVLGAHPKILNFFMCYYLFFISFHDTVTCRFKLAISKTFHFDQPFLPTYIEYIVQLKHLLDIHIYTHGDFSNWFTFHSHFLKYAYN